MIKKNSFNNVFGKKTHFFYGHMASLFLSFDEEEKSFYNVLDGSKWLIFVMDTLGLAQR